MDRLLGEADGLVSSEPVAAALVDGEGAVNGPTEVCGPRTCRADWTLSPSSPMNIGCCVSRCGHRLEVRPSLDRRSPEWRNTA